MIPAFTATPSSSVRVLVATRPGNDNTVGLAGKLGLTRRPDLDHSGFLLFSS